MTIAPSASIPSAPAVGIVLPAPGSSSPIYGPNPGAIVVAIDPGHGGCLDWGVPNPWDNTAANAEKTSTLGIALQLRDRLRAAGVSVVMARDADEAIAGDDYPPQGCDGPQFRDVNGDGLAGFGSDLPEGTLARDELQARIDLANVARADVLLSIHINSFVDDDGDPIEIAASQTFYTDETAWGPASAGLAADVQSGAVAGLRGAPYPRQDRGTEAKNYYVVAPPLFAPTEDRPDPWKQPARGALMPAVLSEVGSMSLEAEATYLRAPAGQAALADGLFNGLATWFAARPLAVRWTIDGDVSPPQPAPGDGPPFWAPLLPDAAPLVTLTNSGTRTWPADVRLLGAWEASSAPYLRVAPVLDELAVDLPRLRAGESVTVELPMSMPLARAVAWIDLKAGGQRLSDLGSPALQVATKAH
ncbi:MAG: N-acetylmuramoyl-L-alanine amidase [Chloroflexota bacterium]